jgi:hypothetical protein
MTDRTIAPGDIVAVASNGVLFITGSAVTLPPGSRGVVVEVDQDGDLLVRFDSYPTAIGVLADDLLHAPYSGRE